MSGWEAVCWVPGVCAQEDSSFVRHEIRVYPRIVVPGSGL